jgi:acetylornithine deacetylase/succinyl-diaminopimelate desuccinylase-like protein
MKRCLLFLWLALSAVGSAQQKAAEPAKSLAQQVERYWDQQQWAILAELRDFLALPNVARNLEDIHRNAAHLQELMERRGVRSSLLAHGGGPPSVAGELKVPGATRTVLLYAHYDGQPVATEHWASDPWTPTLRSSTLESGGEVIPWESIQGQPLGLEWRLYGRAASDDKAPIIAMLAALDALAAAGRSPAVNLRFFFEGEEEAGSTHLRGILDQSLDQLRADVMLLCDGPVHPTRRLQLVYGARGVIGVEFKVYGPLQPLHSGHYGNWAPNPAARLSHLLAGMRGPDGRILIEDFYADVREPTARELGAVAAAPDMDETLRKAYGLAHTEGGGSRVEECILRPALNIRGLSSGNVGSLARNAIPHTATASIDFRLVPDQTIESVRKRVEGHLRAQGYTILREDPSASQRAEHPHLIRVQWGPGYSPARTSLDLPICRQLVRILREEMQQEVIELPTLGGSVPIRLFQDRLNLPVIVVPTVNHDNHQHAPNENLRLQNLRDAIEIFAQLFARLGES